MQYLTGGSRLPGSVLCRAELAAPLLENTDAKIVDIAARLGYRNQSNFTRAFYRWAEVSPSEFRKQRSQPS